MKKGIKLFFLLVLSNGLLGQINVSTPEIYVLYVGLDNCIQIETNDGKKHDFIIEIYQTSRFNSGEDVKTFSKYENASIIKDKSNRYHIRINKENGNLLMVTKSKINGKYLDYGRQIYFVKNVPRPVLYLGRALNYDSTINLIELKKLRYLSVELPNFTRTDLNYKLVSYKFLVIGINTGGPKIVTVNSASLESIQSILDMLVPGDFIQFSDIIIVGPAQEMMLRDNFSGIIGSLNTNIFNVKE